MLSQVTPLLFLDVDGVLCPVRGPSEAWTDWEEVPCEGYSLVLSRAMADRIIRLPASITWLTTWGHLANTQIGAWLGWPTFGVLEPAEQPASLTWKLDAVREHLAGNDASFVWIDDHLDAMADAIGAALVGGPRLLVAPDPYVGLTPDELDNVERFLKNLNVAHL
jgi:hypothetical protein